MAHFSATRRADVVRNNERDDAREPDLVEPVIDERAGSLGRVSPPPRPRRELVGDLDLRPVPSTGKSPTWPRNSPVPRSSSAQSPRPGGWRAADAIVRPSRCAVSARSLDGGLGVHFITSADPKTS